MNRADPTTAETNFLSATDREFSVDEVAEIQALDATMAGTESSIPGVESSETQTKELEPKLQKLSIPSPVARRAVSGLYRSGGMGFQLELRIDVQGDQPAISPSFPLIRKPASNSRRPAATM